MSVNTVVISGNLVKDYELKKTKNGSFIGRLVVAVDSRKKNEAGEWEDYPNYFDCSIFGTRAEALEPLLTKGLLVTVQGELQHLRWQNHEGENRSRVEILCREIAFKAPPKAQPDSNTAVPPSESVKKYSY
jgi:single-strand DNA-binding protein